MVDATTREIVLAYKNLAEQAMKSKPACSHPLWALWALRALFLPWLPVVLAYSLRTFAQPFFPVFIAVTVLSEQQSALTSAGVVWGWCHRSNPSCNSQRE